MGVDTFRNRFRRVGLLPLVALAAVAVVGPGAADAGVKRFKNCTAVHKTYKHGIAKSSRAARTANGLHGKPKISLALYNANKKMDRDRDGVACEK